MFSAPILAVLAASGSLAYPVLSERQSASCATGVYMIVARGSTEAPGEGVESSVVSAVQQSISGSNGLGIDYPASLTDYTSSESQGVTAMTQAIQSYVQSCPDRKIALMGFSQGAQVVGDVLGGGSMSSSAPIDSSYTKNIVAAILFGDPTHVAGKPYDVGSSTNNGVFPRPNTATLDSYAAILQSYCDSGDEFCDNGGNAIVHAEEVSSHGSAAAQFIVARAQAVGSSGGSGGSPTATGTVVPTPDPTTSAGGFPGLPTGFPGGFPTGFPTGFPGGFPTGFPGGFPTGFPGGFPTGFPGLPSGITLPTGFPGGIP